VRRVKIVFDVSGHGFGHLAQVGPVIRRLAQRCRDVEIIVRADHAPDLVASFVGAAIRVLPASPQPTLVMRGPLDVDRQATARCYRAFHADWDGQVRREAAILADLDLDLLVSDAPYLGLAAAARLAKPALGLCSLNWLDLFRAYCAIGPAEARIADEIAAAYGAVVTFLQPAPHMPMPDLPHRTPIGPIARLGRNRAADIRARLGLAPARALALATIGGAPGKTHVDLPRDPAVFWLADPKTAPRRDDTAWVGDLGLPFIDILASADVTLTKDGYATLVEAVCNGVPMVMMARPDWPETPYLQRWADEHGRFAALGAAFGPSEILAAMRTVLARPPTPPVEPTGVEAAVAVIAQVAGLRLDPCP
jgi:hypothetical protein